MGILLFIFAAMPQYSQTAHPLLSTVPSKNYHLSSENQYNLLHFFLQAQNVGFMGI
jgi:hypothetical protein